ncbi:uncharacterized protein LOC111294678 [Durio zibethinus]|uniref:Uncharacterized protein LOC111294678 n=1 Tax=Durio zibethinus TaxID=66656 RepID=A0A6P5YU58_DURZI|nr:uncharacterized protein LOC111294678 [Durio zibethinus]
MDNENSQVEEIRTVSALQVNELFLRKILARNNSFMDNSVDVPYQRSVGEIPFEWESQPGTPRHHHLIPRKEIIVPPIRPPPASSWNGQEFDGPCNTDMSSETKTWLWKKYKKSCQGNKKARAKSQGNFEFDHFYMSSSSKDSRSSSSTSSNGISSRLRSLTDLVKWAF